MSILAVALESIKVNGLWATLRQAPSFFWWRLKTRAQDDGFDEERGTDTGGIVVSGQSKGGGINAKFSAGYFGTRPSSFHRAIKSIPIDYERTWFIDVGSGKGRVVLMAADFPFKKIVGIEFSKDLHDVAVRNVGVLNRTIDLVNCDAVTYEFPAEPIVIFMYCPFIGEVFGQVMANLKSCFVQCQNDIILIYHNPALHDVVMGLGIVTHVATIPAEGDDANQWNNPPTHVYRTMAR